MKHIMNLVKKYDDGHCLFSCPECGRAFKLRIKPYSKVVLVKGNDGVFHSGGIGDISISNVSVTDRLYPYEDFIDGELFDG